MINDANDANYANMWC